MKTNKNKPKQKTKKENKQVIEIHIYVHNMTVPTFPNYPPNNPNPIPTYTVTC